MENSPKEKFQGFSGGNGDHRLAESNISHIDLLTKVFPDNI